MAYGNPFGGFAPMYPGYAPQMAQAMPDQLAQLRGAAQYPPMNQQQGGGLIWVQGEAGAKSYLVAPGQNLLLMDSERNSFYLKSADASGIPTLRVFDYTERTAQAAPPAQNSPQYATRAEVDEIKAQLSALMKRTKEGMNDEQPAV
jgi:hypothetical protein